MYCSKDLHSLNMRCKKSFFYMIFFFFTLLTANYTWCLLALALEGMLDNQFLFAFAKPDLPDLYQILFQLSFLQQDKSLSTQPK